MCRKSWDSLADTDSLHVRYCANCDKGVFKVRTRAELALASQMGRCVALTDDNKIVRWIGKSRVAPMEEALETVAIRTHSPLDASTQRRLRLAFPKVTDIADGLPPGMWITIGTFSPHVAADLDADIRAQFPDVEIQKR